MKHIVSFTLDTLKETMCFSKHSGVGPRSAGAVDAVPPWPAPAAADGPSGDLALPLPPLSGFDAAWIVGLQPQIS